MTRYLGPKTDAANPATQSDLASGSLISGSGAPTSETGSNGNFYIDTASGQLYGPKTTGTWGGPISLGAEQTRAFSVFIA